MKKAVIIDLPDAELMRSMAEEAWSTFHKEAISKGVKIPAEAKALLPTFFLAGYCNGYNDLLYAIKQQLEAEEAANDLIEGL